MPASHWKIIAQCAARRNIPLLLSMQEAWELYVTQEGQCALTGVAITFKGSGAKTASLDRIDSGKPYILGNVRWVHKTINIMKHFLSDHELYEWCRLLLQHKVKVDENQSVNNN